MAIITFNIHCQLASSGVALRQNDAVGLAQWLEVGVCAGVQSVSQAFERLQVARLRSTAQLREVRQSHLIIRCWRCHSFRVKPGSIMSEA